MSTKSDILVTLSLDEIPKKWYNIAADLKGLQPPLHPGTKEPVTAEDLAPVFTKSMIKQEMSTERYIDIPDEVRENYIRLNRPSSLQRAVYLEKYLKTPAKIYFKREDLSPVGSHKGNSALAQAYYCMKDGIHTITTETGAGQWGTALALASSIFDLDCTVFMVRISYDQKPFRRTIMQTYGAKVYASPSLHTEYGKKVLKEVPDSPGSLGMAISEAIEVAVGDPNIKYTLGSVSNGVMLHQTVIGLETIEQMKKAEIEPDYMVGCVGGGSNFSGFAFPMMREKMLGKTECEFIAAEPKAAASLSEGEYRYDFGDTACMTPLFKMYTLGHDFVPSPIHAGGLRYHGMSPLLSEAFNQGLLTARSYDQTATFEAGMIFAKAEGIIPAPESSHAIRAAIDLALEAKEKDEEKTIVFCLSGHGLLDLAGYERHISGNLVSSSRMS
ncbi:MAG: TrpB-like pyridoxal phosphate-dependent enzyme [Methanomassiliicoccaceae archaeon]|nr:TrpB-like pyridoxal phosphate-dependent enzyme [Methanomassiliicoccaceae archaeon]